MSYIQCSAKGVILKACRLVLFPHINIRSSSPKSQWSILVFMSCSLVNSLHNLPKYNIEYTEKRSAVELACQLLFAHKHNDYGNYYTLGMFFYMESEPYSHLFQWVMEILDSVPSSSGKVKRTTSHNRSHGPTTCHSY